MEFGKVENPGEINFTLPADAPETEKLWARINKAQPFEAYIGCTIWNKADLKGFYPKGTKDELRYYGNQFNSIELNATFYNLPSNQQVIKWKNKTPPHFKFFPKITNTISHYKRLINIQQPLIQYCDAISNFEEKLGMVFLQLHDNFKPKEYDKLENFVKEFPKVIPLAIELRNEDWFLDYEIFQKVYQLFHNYNITNIIIDNAGRRNMLHMALTTPTAFIRYVGANHESDYQRLDEWVSKITAWKTAGLQNLYFFVHQNKEESSHLLAAYFIEKLNKAIGTNLTIPKLPTANPTLF